VETTGCGNKTLMDAAAAAAAAPQGYCRHFPSVLGALQTQQRGVAPDEIELEAAIE